MTDWETASERERGGGGESERKRDSKGRGEEGGVCSSSCWLF